MFSEFKNNINGFSMIDVHQNATLSESFEGIGRVLLVTAVMVWYFIDQKTLVDKHLSLLWIKQCFCYSIQMFFQCTVILLLFYDAE